MKLATVQEITGISPIPNADSIEVAKVLGWEVVVKKGEFVNGQKVVYIQIDTIAPQTPDFEFLRSRDFRIRTIKLRGQISQGLIIPLPSNMKNLKVGSDVTEEIGVKKYEKEQKIEERVKPPKKWYKRYWWLFKRNVLVRFFPSLKELNSGPFPKNLVPITDEERIQNIPFVLNECKGVYFMASEKLDGSSITLILKKNWLGKYAARVCSRTKERFGMDNEFYKVYKSTNFLTHLKALADWYGTSQIIVQVEYIGKPQGNKYKLKENEIRLFNIFVKGNKQDQYEFWKTCQRLNIPHCPVVWSGELNWDLKGIIAYAEGKSALADVEREGLVFRCVEQPKISFKVISNKFLIENKE